MLRFSMSDWTNASLTSETHFRRCARKPSGALTTLDKNVTVWCRNTDRYCSSSLGCNTDAMSFLPFRNRFESVSKRTPGLIPDLRAKLTQNQWVIGGLTIQSSLEDGGRRKHQILIRAVHEQQRQSSLQWLGSSIAGENKQALRDWSDLSKSEARDMLTIFLAELR